MTSYIWVTQCPQLLVNIGCFRVQFSRVILHWMKFFLWFLLWPWKHHLRIKNISDVYKLKLYCHVILRLYLIVVYYDMQYSCMYVVNILITSLAQCKTICVLSLVVWRPNYCVHRHSFHEHTSRLSRGIYIMYLNFPPFSGEPV
jgi:hypothetical protein